MLQLRVYRLTIPLTIMGLEIWAVFTAGFGSVMSMQLYRDIEPSILAFPLAGGTAYIMLVVVGQIKRHFPGKAFVHTMQWISQGDRYLVGRETRSAPLVLPDQDLSLRRHLDRHRTRFKPSIKSRRV